METMHHERICGERSCGRSSVASLSQQGLCLEHFLFSCYEELRSAWTPGRAFSSQPPTWPPCELSSKSVSRKALDISLHPRTSAISNAAAFWISCYGPASFPSAPRTEAYVPESPASDVIRLPPRGGAESLNFASFPPAFSLECALSPGSTLDPILDFKNKLYRELSCSSCYNRDAV